MPVTGSSTLPVAARDHPWDGPAARRRVLEACEGSVACISRAFLWRDPDGDPTTQSAWGLGFADWIDGRLQIVPRGVAATAGGRGVDAASGIPDAETTRIKQRICSLYTRIRGVYDDWPDCPVAPRSEARAVIRAAADDPNKVEGPIAFEGEDTGDNRRIKRGALRWDGPVPLIFSLEEMGHTGMQVGTIDEFRREGKAIVGRGSLHESENEEVAAAVLRVRELMDPDGVGVSIITDDDDWETPDEEHPDRPMTLLSGRVRQVAIVDVPAFRNASLALVASAMSVDWFQNPNFGGENDPRLVWQEPERPEEEAQFGAPLVVTEEGQVWGHVALFGRCHVGYPGTCVRPPKEPAAYRGFLTGDRTGTGIPTGPIIWKIGHAPLGMDANDAIQHYANGKVIADVTIGPDEYGIWVAGAIRADATPVDVENFRASALSGDWRILGGRHRLIGILRVNGPAFRVARAIAASGTLITVGPGCEPCLDVLLEDRVAELERIVAAIPR